MKSFQLSSRTGCMNVKLVDDKTLLIMGHAVIVLEGKLKV